MSSELHTDSIINGAEPDRSAAAFGACPLPISAHKEIVLAHGSGGKLTHELIQKMVLPQFRNELLQPLHDGAMFSINSTRLAFSTDSFVVSPIFFPGGDSGTLAVNGPVNDLERADVAAGKENGADDE